VKQRILVVDDEEFVRSSLVDLLESENLSTVSASSAEQALEILEAEKVSLVVTDLRMSNLDGLGLLEAARKQAVEAPVIVLTGVGTVAEAVRAMKLGAFDFVQKPVDPEQFVLLVRRALDHRALVTEVKYLRGAVEDLRGSSEMVGGSNSLDGVRRLIRQVAPTDATVLVTGESGTGKELIASEIHTLSPRARGSFVRINCAAVPESLFESELFGHRRGAFTSAVADRRGRFAEADGGTLVLDEIGTLRLEMQAKLLRVLETGEYQVIGEPRTRLADVRVIAVTNEDLAAGVRAGSFRKDLYYRLNIFPIHVPPLRDRREDIPMLAAHFAERWRGRVGGGGGMENGPPGASRLTEAAAEALRSHDWPGNIRELRNVVERACILAPRDPIDAPLIQGILARPQLLESAAQADLHIRRRVEALERELIAEALGRTGGRKRDAAALLGIDPKNFGYYLRKHDVAAEEDGEP
jgi:DNA-binding NtrC family response regulator